MPILFEIRNQRGIALLYLIILFTILGVLVSAGVRQFGSAVNLGKIKDTKAELERDVQMVTAWAVKNRKLPSSSAEYFSVFGTTPPLDSWGKEIIFLYDASVSTGEFCGRTSSASQYSGANVGFILVSGGDDSTVNSTPTPTATAAVALLPAGNYNTLSSSDLYRFVSLDELKSMAGCAGSTQGSLKILNNELPSVCVGSSSYDATVYATGGVLSYTWQPETNLPTPNWLSRTVNGSDRKLAKSALPIVASAPNLTFSLTDSGVNSVSKVLPIKVGYTNSCSAALTACMSDSACRTACNSVPDCYSVCKTGLDPACRNACNDPGNPTCVSDCPNCVP